MKQNTVEQFKMTECHPGSPDGFYVNFVMDYRNTFVPSDIKNWDK
jgi:hypothetical protein